MYQLTQNNTVIFQSVNFDQVWKYALRKLGNLTAEQYVAKGYSIDRAVLA